MNNLPKKFVLINSRAGFGNKIFDLIVALYIKYNYNYNIYFYDSESIHTKEGDPNLNDIFPNIKDLINFITKEKSYFMRNYIDFEIKDNVSNLNDFKKLLKDKNYIRPHILYNFVFEMYESFDDKYKSYFIINNKLIDENLNGYIKTKYAIIHIRYGDKIKESIKRHKKDSTFISFPIYTPQYYYEQILNIKRLNIPIIILTDSINLVRKFIINHYNLQNDNDIFMPDINFINSFYILQNSSYCVLSHSTFSYAAFLLANEHLKKIYIFCLTNKYKFYKPLPYDLFIHKKSIIIDNNKFILNFNQKLLKEMKKYINLNK